MAFDNIKLDKGLYGAGKGFTQALEGLDPGEQYKGTALEGLDAYERQLKRFGIRVSGPGSDRVEKFFRSSETAVLFPEFVARTVKRGMEEASKLGSLVAATTQIEGLDYRSLRIDSTGSGPVGEGETLPEFKLLTKGSLVNMKKFGYLINTSYEAMRHHRLDLFNVMLRKIGAMLASGLIGEAVQVLIHGDGNPGTAAVQISKAGTSLSYTDLLALWNNFYMLNMTGILVSADTARQILALPEMRDGCAGLDFHGSGRLITPLGAELIACDAVPAETLVGFDKNCALELVQAGDVVTDADRLIDRQFHSAGVSITAGFAKIFSAAAVVME